MRARAASNTHVQRTRRVLRLCVLGSLLGAARGHAQELQGFAPDAQLTGGAGFAFGHKLDNYFIARARLGLLWAHEQWIANLGPTFTLGALGRLGGGGELELNVVRGFFGSVGLERVDGAAWMGHATLGWLVFGLEWQHRFSAPAPSDALMFEVRVPFGSWWFEKRQQKSARSEAPVPSSPPRQLGPTTQRAPETIVQPRAAQNADSALADAQLTASLAEADHARQNNDAAAETLALTRAVELRADAQLALRLAELDVQRGKWLHALQALLRASTANELTAADRALITERRAQLQARLPHLRLELRPSDADVRVSIDGVLEPSATVGYDVPLDPGDHVLTLQGSGRALAERTFHADEAQLVRLSIELPSSPAP